MDLNSGALARFASGLAACLALLSPMAGNADQQRPCQEDLKKLCADAKPGPDTRKCLIDNMDKLSEGCRQRISAVRGRRQGYPARFRGCEGDLEKFCKDTMPGGGRLLQCLREHEQDLTADCKSRLPGARAHGGTGGGGSGNGTGHGDGTGSGKGNGTGAGKSNGNGSGGAQTSNAAPAQGKATTESK